VDDVSGGVSRALGIDLLGDVFSVGVSGGNEYITRKSADHGATWTLADEMNSGNGNAVGGAYAFGMDSAGNLYTTGFAIPTGDTAQHYTTRTLSCH
jgi:hypothetical protein